GLSNFWIRLGADTRKCTLTRVFDPSFPGLSLRAGPFPTLVVPGEPGEEIGAHRRAQFVPGRIELHLMRDAEASEPVIGSLRPARREFVIVRAVRDVAVQHGPLLPAGQYGERGDAFGRGQPHAGAEDATLAEAGDDGMRRVDAVGLLQLFDEVDQAATATVGLAGH